MYIISHISLGQLYKLGKLTAVLPIGNFSRLPDWCLLTKDVVVNIEMIPNELQTENEIWLAVSFNIEFSTVCQRCLGELMERIDFSVVGKKKSRQDTDFYFSREEIFDTENAYCKNNELDILRLCEDELLLALPMVPKHKSDCGPPIYGENVRKIKISSPFASLSKNKDKK